MIAIARPNLNRNQKEELIISALVQATDDWMCRYEFQIMLVNTPNEALKRPWEFENKKAHADRHPLHR